MRRPAAFAGTAALVVLLLTAWAAPAAEGFAPRLTYTVGDFPVGIAAADFNKDGRMDLAVANRDDNNVSILYRQPDGSYGGRADYAAGNGLSRAVAADMNADGWPDLVVNERDSDRVSVYYGQAGGGFGRSTYTAGNTPVGLAVADINSDSRPDVVVTNFYDDHTVSVLYARAGGGFAAPVGYATARNPDSVVVADFDKDSRLDLAVTCCLDDVVSVLYGQVGGGFGGRTDYAAGRGPRGLVTDDFDRDGWQDLAVTHYNSSSADNPVVVLYGQAPGGFGSPEELAMLRKGYGIATADFNLDGLPDLAASRLADSETLYVYYGKSEGGFTTGVTYHIGRAYNIVAVDLDGDGDADIAAANYWTDSVSVLYNMIPEPAALAFLGLGALALLRRRRRK